MENGMLEHRYRDLRRHLDELGYRQPLVVESIALVERLVIDLLHTTQSLRHYKELAQRSLEECSNLELGAGPYKLDNARLVKDCNELNLKLLQLEEDANKTQKDLKLQVRKLESEKSDLQFLSSKHLATIKTLEQESAQKTRKILQLQGKYAPTIISGSGGKKKTFSTKPQATFELNAPLKQGKSWQEQCSRVPSEAKKPYIADLMVQAGQQIANQNREINVLKEDKVQQSETIATLTNKLNAREREMQRLVGMLEGGRPLAAIRKDSSCTCKDTLHKVNSLAKEVEMLGLKNKELEQKLKDSVASRREAEEQAGMLAERNKQLEKELEDVDQMALAVEAEYNSAVKDCSARAEKYQKRMKNNLQQVHDLELEILELKRNNQELQAIMEGLKQEKHRLQKKLETALDEKKKHLDRINELNIIERDLNKEIESKIQTTTLQQRKIAELESQLVCRVTHPDAEPGRTQKKMDREKRPKIKSPTRAPTDHKGATVVKSTSPETHIELNSDHYEALIKKLQSERDFFYNECLRLKGEKRITSPNDNSSELRRQLNVKEQQLMELQQTNRELVKEREILRSCIDAAPKIETHSTMTSPLYVPAATDAASAVSLEAMIKRLEQERDMARGNIEHLEEERDALRDRLKLSTETQLAEHARFETAVTEYEERIHRLEAERQELLASQGFKKATVSNLESQIESLQSQLITARSELTEQRAHNNQVKTSQEQSDRALADSQGQLHQSEMNLRNSQERVRLLEKDRAKLDTEVTRLEDEISTVRETLARVDEEKDGLMVIIDNKTEKVAMLEQELKATEDRLLKKEEALAEARKKLSIALDDIASRDAKARSSERDAESLRRELETVKHARESTFAENRLLHSDLAKLTEECRRACTDRESSRQEVENLKLQLQGYVSEVKRVEEQLSRKDEERTTMLDHFRSLSVEASALENNNHSLETEIQDARAQLRATNDRITDLEQLLESKDTLVNNYERQIADLSGSVARLETQIRDELNRRHRAEEDLGVLQDLCAKLDSQKDSLMQQVAESNRTKMQLETELSRLRDEQIVLQEKLTKGAEAIETLEGLLTTCRKDTLDQKLANQTTLGEVNLLREKITALQDKLDTGSLELHRRQQQAAKLSQQVSELQRCVTNERFERARREEECRRLNQLLNDHGQTTGTFHTSTPSNQSRQSNLTRAPLHKDANSSCPVSTGEASCSSSFHQPISSPQTVAYFQLRVPKQQATFGQKDKLHLPRFAQSAVKLCTSPCFRPVEHNVAGLNTTEGIFHKKSSAPFAVTQPSDPCSPPHWQKTKRTIHVTFALTVPTSSFSPTYAIVRQGGETKTTDSTDISMSTGVSTRPPKGIKPNESHNESVSSQDEHGVQADT